MRLRKILIFSAMLMVAGCAHHYIPAESSPYGFFSGLWHGLIFIFSLIGCIISGVMQMLGINLFDVEIIGRPNTGFFFYYPGFIIGLIFHFKL